MQPVSVLRLRTAVPSSIRVIHCRGESGVQRVIDPIVLVDFGRDHEIGYLGPRAAMRPMAEIAFVDSSACVFQRHFNFAAKTHEMPDLLTIADGFSDAIMKSVTRTATNSSPARPTWRR